MKKITILSLMLFAIIKGYSQDYLISFAAAGASTTFDWIKVENITQNTNITIPEGNQLRLKAEVTGMNIKSDNTESALLIYPNPAKEFSIVEFDVLKGGSAIFEVLDLSGRQLAQMQSYLASGNHSYIISGLGSGVYIISVKATEYNYSGKIVGQSVFKGNVQIHKNDNSDNNGSIHINGLKSTDIESNMQYTTGDRLKFTGISGAYRTVFMDIPTESKTITFTFVGCTDGDNNNYPIVTIGTQTWMAENLKTTHYSNGNPLPQVTGNSNWDALTATSMAYCWYNDDSTSFAQTYGALYTWAVAMNGAASSTSNPSEIHGVCPTNWHLPSDAEWSELTDYLGGSNISGGKLKEAGTSHWFAQITEATNETGFTALPGGYRDFDGTFGGISLGGNWWSSTENSSIFSYYRFMSCEDGVGMEYGDKQFGLSVRCVKDE